MLAKDNITEIRRRGETAAGSDSADFKCQVSSLKGIRMAGEGFREATPRSLPALSVCLAVYTPSIELALSFIYRCGDKTPSFLSEYDSTGQRSDQFIGSSKSKTKRNNVQSGL